ncbi:hypothetical protein AKO1_012786 [Acrasis kona]|uniref:Uncharacterized protein n=1 Tax=Acrasis kona TaxID=1008807 RepID=A0AAW2YX86_9EUKA
MSSEYFIEPNHKERFIVHISRGDVGKFPHDVHITIQSNGNADFSFVGYGMDNIFTTLEQSEHQPEQLKKIIQNHFRRVNFEDILTNQKKLLTFLETTNRQLPSQLILLDYLLQKDVNICDELGLCVRWRDDRRIDFFVNIRYSPHSKESFLVTRECISQLLLSLIGWNYISKTAKFHFITKYFKDLHVNTSEQTLRTFIGDCGTRLDKQKRRLLKGFSGQVPLPEYITHSNNITYNFFYATYDNAAHRMDRYNLKSEFPLKVGQTVMGIKSELVDSHLPFYLPYWPPKGCLDLLVCCGGACYFSLVGRE